jgi:DNA-binding PadR family transcriptional regulator
MSILAMYEEVDFKFLKEELKATDGNLSVNLKKLEEAGYLISKKEFVARKPRTTYRITNRGVEQLKQYLEKMSFFKERIEKGLS